LLAVALLVALLGLVGTPPTGVFVGKLTTATAAWDAGMAWLTVAVLVNSVASLFYYLSWIAPVFRALDRGEGKTVVPHRPWSTWTAVGTATLSLALGVAGGVVWQIADGRLVS
jgi:NADH-quinone oxidoreductase subunit N